ncbi:MAG: multidrug effflux MFS transporter [Rhodobacteraceae bacterium]|nr:multidrug effflux MFS transporter [Paracoccaceae bacterium]
MSKSILDRPDGILFLGGITALTAISIDIVLPATAVIARDFGVDEALGAMLVGAYFLAFAVGQLFWGLFSDAYGRRLALILSLSGFTVASIACALAPSFETLIALRALQGLMGGTPVIARAMVRDERTGNDAARLLALLMSIVTIATLIAPVLGSGLLVLFEWRAIFWALGLLSLVFLAYALFALKETDAPRRPDRFSFRFVASASRKLFGMRAFVFPMLMGSFAFAGYSAMLSVGAVLTETVYDVSPQAFGSLFALAALANTFGALGIRALLGRMPVARVNAIAVMLMTLASLAAAATVFITPGLPLFWGVICLYVMSFGMVLPTSVALAMDPAGEMPGFAASLMGAMQMGFGAGGALLATMIFDRTHTAIPETMAIFGALTFLTFLLGRKTMRG